MRQIPLRSRKYPGLTAMVDDDDYERVARYPWWPWKPATGHTFYARTTVEGKSVTLHRFIMGVAGMVDHRDGNGLNCQKSNMREATRGEQMQNRARATGPLNHPPYKGVYPTGRQRNPWKASIRVNDVQSHIGVFPTPEAAAHAYDRAAREHFGEFARTNFQETE